jgi:RHS repeat-associated protein
MVGANVSGSLTLWYQRGYVYSRLTASSADYIWGVEAGIQNIHAGGDVLLSTRADLGAKIVRTKATQPIIGRTLTFGMNGRHALNGGADGFANGFWVVGMPLLPTAPADQTEGGDFGDPRYNENHAGYISDPVNPLSGEFHLLESDLLVEAPLPLRFTRSYSSHNLSSNELGWGWLTDIHPYLAVTPGETTITATTDTGSTIRYSRVGLSEVWLPNAGENLDINNEGGGGKNPLLSRVERTIANGQVRYRLFWPDGGTRDYVTRSLPTNAFTRQRPWLESRADAAGNRLTYTFGENSTAADHGRVKRITASNGAHLSLTYYPGGLLEKVESNDGRLVSYTYVNGDLKTVTKPDLSVITYDYGTHPDGSSNHLVIRVTKSDGRVLENDFDSLRRVQRQRATVDPSRPGVLVQNAVFDHTTIEQVKVTDAYGRQTIYEQSDSLITAIREPLSRTTLQGWYATTNTTGAYARALKKRTDPRGLVTEHKYDARGNITETKITGDLDGDPSTPPTETHVVTALYNTHDLPDWIADSATGLTTDYFYEDADYPRLATRVVLKHTATGVVLRTDKFDHTEREAPAPAPATGTIFARGLLAKRTLAHDSPDEAVTDYDHDATGFRTSEIRRTGTTDPDVLLAFAPTARRELYSVTDAAGRQALFTYDALSRPRTKTVKDETAATLAVTATTYNAHGEVTRVGGPRSGPDDYLETDYDQAGRPSETRAWRVQAKADGGGVEAPPAPADKSVSRLYHDLFGNLVLLVDPKGHATTHQYDALGRRTHTRRFATAHAAALLSQYQADQLAVRPYDGSLPSGVPSSAVLSLETFTYEPGGQVETHVDVLGGTTTTLYNSRGQPRKRTAPDGSVTEWRYHPDGRLAREILRDGSYWQIDYDDVARTTTRTLKKAAGTVLATETRVHDRRGNLVSLTDAEGSVFATTHDDLDRVKTATGPATTATSAQQSTTTTYDAAGILTITANALGEKTLVTRDALGRVTREEIRDVNDAPVRVGATAYSPDHHSATLTQGTGTGAIVTTTYTDPQRRPLLTRFADGTYQRQTYDLAGLPAETRDPLSRLTTTTFDALGHLATRTLPDGHLTTFVHNPAGQLLERRMASPQGTLVDKTAYDGAGRITSRRLVNGASETRLYSYAYHPATHATWAGLPAAVTDPRGVVSTFAYDDFLRVQSVTTDGPAPETDSTTTYVYDRRGLLTQLVQSAPANGPPTIVSRPRDAYGRASSETITLDGSTLAQFAQHWDAAGRRARLLPGTPSPSSAYSAAPEAYVFTHRAAGLLVHAAAGGFAANFGHGDHGLPGLRENPWRVQSTARDSLGRPQTSVTRLATAATALQTETQTWRADGTLDTYAVARSAPGVWTESRAYGYDNRARVTSEGFSVGPAPGQTAALAATFDHGAVGLGVRTDLKVGTGAPAAWQSRVPASSAINAFARVTGDETNAAGKPIAATGVSLGADYVELWVNGAFKGRAAHPGWADNTGAWSATLPLDAGAQTLEARAVHPSGAYTATATNAFTVSVPLASITSTHDAEGNVTSRTFGDGRVQTLTWDAFNRLVRVTERDAAQTGSDWSAVYDGFGRRLRTTHQPVVAGAATGTPTIIVSLYDPEHEFLELAVIVNGAPAWKVHGPDLNGAYGGWNGTGGLEAVLTPNPESNNGGFVIKAVVSDAFGNVVATVTGLGPLQRAEWLTTRVGGYGPLPNHRAELLTSPLRLAESSAWRTRRVDPTGFYWLGARYYEPQLARFLSPDPLGHGSDPSLYAFANGDPVNGFDPDGRFGKDANGNPYGLIFRQQNGQMDVFFDYLGNTGSANNLQLSLFDDAGNRRFTTFEDYRNHAFHLMGMTADLAQGFGDNLLGQQAEIDRMVDRMTSRYDTGLGRLVTATDLSANLALGYGMNAFSSPTAGAAGNTSIRWGPATGAGPLGEKIAATFRGGSYTQNVTSETTTLYRAYGGTAGEVGGYWTRTAPTGPLQARIDSALAPQWGNTAQSVSTIRVPPGTTIFEGFAAPQGNLIGGGSQVFIPNVNPSWLVK